MVVVAVYLSLDRWTIDDDEDPDCKGAKKGRLYETTNSCGGGGGGF